ncbi:sodium:proton exchanger [candidate division KSB3 bacterium]|uniref:Sodium:proton exchanger n=1 Tax=candidate division KSB3 bacterium TaxID=2044937 RepID=A0A2G6E8L1_9BACT|nr:MAG: sodium:proton exchanger [candidate division KSB3 bacterium]PIE30458.1 MAG: sodium:proton exchanger [candidate division KSB3 bacterium]
MFDELSIQFSAVHINMLFLLGLALFGGTIGGRLFQKFKIPQVVGYISIGIILGRTGIHIVSLRTIENLQPFNYFALGLIGFMIGGELKTKIFVKYGKQFLTILLFEGLTAFLIVTALAGVAGMAFFPPNAAWALALLLGAIASATAPAATTDVLWEYKTKGPLTTTILGIVALDDGLALMLFALATSIAGSLTGQSVEGGMLILTPMYEILGAIVIGGVSGFVLSKLLRYYSEEDRVLAFAIGTVLFVLGVSLVLTLDMLLAAMTLGAVVTNAAPRKSQDVFKIVGRVTPPIYVLFFVLVGAKLNVNNMPAYMILLALLYLLGRTGGKMVGAYLGAKFSHAPRPVRLYLPLCLFSQAGVAIGLSILAGQRFAGDVGNTIVLIVTATTFIVQIIGPPFVKLAVQKAGEVGLNITEDDLIATLKVADIMDRAVPTIPEDMPLHQITQTFSEHNNLYFPVVNQDNTLAGIITVDTIKNTLMHSELNQFLVAIDVMETIPATAHPNTPMENVKALLKQYKLEYLPIVTDENTLEGFLEARAIDRLISRKFLELQAEAL